MSDLTDRLGGAKTALAFKAPCRVATTASITLSGFQTIDGVLLAADDSNLRVLVKNQTDATQNGIYIASTGVWQRAKDFDGNNDFEKGTRVYVTSGSTQAAVYVVTTADPIVIDTSSITFVTESSLLGAGILFEVDGGGAPLLAGLTRYFQVPFSGTITQWTLFGSDINGVPVAGTLSMDVWKDTYANYPPTIADTITGSAPPSLTAAVKNQSSTLTGWTTAVTAGDILAFYVASADGVVGLATLSLTITRIQ